VLNKETKRQQSYLVSVTTEDRGN